MKKKERSPVMALIVPCYNEEAMILDTIKTLHHLIQSLIQCKVVNQASFIVFIDDGSIDNTFYLLKQNKTNSIKIIKLTANKGQQYALLAGLHYVKNKADCAISIDADLQDDLTVIKQMIYAFTNGAHIVCGVRANRKGDRYFKKKSAKYFYWLMHKMGVDLIENHANFRLLSQKALHEISKYKESNLFLRGLFPLINLHLEIVYYNQKRRLNGRSKYSLYKMISLALRGITSFSSVPIRLITIIGILLFIITIILSINVLIVYMKGNVVPGWASITLPMYFLGGIQLLSLGIIGEYVSRIYWETKRRPHYHIEVILE